MKRTVVLAIAALAIANVANGQPPVDWSQPVTGVDGPTAQQADIITAISDLTGKPASAVTEDDLVHYWEQHQASYSHRQTVDLPINAISAEDLLAAAETPLPPPCEAPPPRSTPQPPAPAPAPCRP